MLAGTRGVPLALSPHQRQASAVLGYADHVDLESLKAQGKLARTLDCKTKWINREESRRRHCSATPEKGMDDASMSGSDVVKRVKASSKVRSSSAPKGREAAN